jgi:tetratricopeptide (TPR) repeat protein
LNNCISIDPKDASLYILTAKVCLNHLPDKKKECIGYAKKAVELGGFLSSRSHRILGLACANYAKEATSRTEKQQYQVDALDALQKAYELDKSDYMNAYHLAQQYAELQEIRKAFHYVKKSISLNSGFVDAWMLLALLFTADRSYDKAYKTIANARGQYPNKLRVWYLYARIEEAYESQQRAEKSFKRFSAEIPHLLSLDIQNELKSIISYSDDAKPVKDSSEITAALPTSPQNADDSQMVGLTNYKKQLKCAQYYLLVADAYRRMRLFEDCQKAIRKAHKLVERVVEAVQEINMSRSANVMMSDLKVTEREKQTNEETQPKGMLYGLVDVAVGNHMQSDVIDSEMVHALRSVSAGVHYQQGRYHEERGKEYLSEAIAEYETALVDYPVHKESLLQLGIVQYEQYQKYMLAKSYLQGAVRVDPNFYEAWYHLGMVVKQMGELEESSECFMASLKLEKSAPVVPFDVLLKKKF